MQARVSRILIYLNEVKTRCTYAAVAEFLGVSPQSVGQLLGKRRPEASWVVNSKTGDPTDYLDSEKDPELYRTDRIIKSADVLRRNLGQ
ncbi:MAG: hypothetical protein DRR42_22985 [Gammaproteobacteria bacterium]|nr:MAG: hypothetical protein DRR42_22985 [Gammaproteobacteria bacterium]